MHLTVMVYLIFVFYFFLIAIIFGSFTMFKRVKAKKHFWNKKQALILLSILIVNLPLQLTIFILATAKKSYNFMLVGESLTSDNKLALSLLVVSFGLLVLTVIYCILVSDYLAVKFNHKFLFLFGRKIRLEKIYEITENDNGYFIIRFLEGTRSKKRIAWNVKSPTAKFIADNYSEFINKDEATAISQENSQ